MILRHAVPAPEPIPWPRAQSRAGTQSDIRSETGPDPRLQELRAAIRSIERRPPVLGEGADTSDVEGRAACEGAWTLGEPALDGLLGPSGLEPGGVHEIKPSQPSQGGTLDWPAACAAARRFSLALAVRRLATVPAARQVAPVLLCTSAARTAELGAPYGPGLAALGLDAGRLILVEPARPADVLWAIEEGLKSSGVALVIGEIDDVGLTPARRLALSAACSSTPCLLLTHLRAEAVAATATRWRIAPTPSGPHALDPDAPGAARMLIGLERCRGSSSAPRSIPSLLEWCDVAYRFRMASGMADRAARAGLPEGRARWPMGEARVA